MPKANELRSSCFSHPKSFPVMADDRSRSRNRAASAMRQITLADCFMRQQALEPSADERETTTASGGDVDSTSRLPHSSVQERRQADTKGNYTECVVCGTPFLKKGRIGVSDMYIYIWGFPVYSDVI